MPNIIIDSRSAIPVRLVPFMSDWDLSPDTLVRMLAHNDTYHRVSIPSFHLQADGSYHPMLPKEWDSLITDLDTLSVSLQANEKTDHDSGPVSRNLSIKRLPATTFVWLNELESAYQEACDKGGWDAWGDRRPGDRDLSLNPFLTPKMQALVFEGFGRHFAKTSNQYQQQPDTHITFDELHHYMMLNPYYGVETPGTEAMINGIYRANNGNANFSQFATKFYRLVYQKD